MTLGAEDPEISADCRGLMESKVGALRLCLEWIHSVNKNVLSLYHVPGHLPCMVSFMSYSSLDGRYHWSFSFENET